MTNILGKSEATAEQMAVYLLSKNPNPKISMPVVKFCQLYIDVAAQEGVRGDGLFAQSCWETNDFRFTGTVTPDQNNYAGIGTLNASTKGAYFPDEATGILAQAQHAKTYATKDALDCECVDPRRTAWFVKEKGGIAKHWEELGGSWAVPGYDTKKYSSLKAANDARDSYGYKIINILNDILNMKKESDQNASEGKKMIINVHAGHNPDGKIACGAVSLIKESTEARKVKDEVIRQLRQFGHTVYDCTCDNGTSQSDVLKKIVKKCNSHVADLDISIHFNSGAADNTGNGTTTGTEVIVYSSVSVAKYYAEKVCQAIANLGFRNRGVKYSTGLYVLKKTKAPAMLIECCFVDDKDDVSLYNYKEMASAIVSGITGESVASNDEENEAEKVTPESKILYKVQVGAYRNKANAESMKAKLLTAGFDAFIIEEN